jgi:hypothetical protein
MNKKRHKFENGLKLVHQLRLGQVRIAIKRKKERKKACTPVRWLVLSFVRSFVRPLVQTIIILRKERKFVFLFFRPSVCPSVSVQLIRKKYKFLCRDQTNLTEKKRWIYTVGYHRKTVGFVSIIFQHPTLDNLQVFSTHFVWRKIMFYGYRSKCESEPESETDES